MVLPSDLQHQKFLNLGDNLNAVGTKESKKAHSNKLGGTPLTQLLVTELYPNEEEEKEESNKTIQEENATMTDAEGATKEINNTIPPSGQAPGGDNGNNCQQQQ